MCHFRENETDYLLVCDVKNHCIREIDLKERKVRKVVGIFGRKGSDLLGGEKKANE